MKATIVSLYPLEFNEYVPFLFPPRYYIEPSDGNIPKTLVIGEAFYLVPNPSAEDMPPIRVTKSASAVASSLIYDFRNSSVYATDDAYPAVFYVEGDLTSELVLKNHGDLVKSHLAAQEKWFRILVKAADDDWQKFHQHRAISDLHRVAAKKLNLEREWLDVDLSFIACPACGTQVRQTQAVCQNCRCVINPKAYENLKFVGVKA